MSLRGVMLSAAMQQGATETVPGTISDLAATPGNTQVSLSWTAPSGPPTDYDVEYRPPGEQYFLSDGTNANCCTRTAAWAQSTLIDCRIDIEPDDWSPASSTRIVEGHYFWIRSTGLRVEWSNVSLQIPDANMTQATLGLTNGVRAQVRVVVDIDADTFDAYTREGGAITDLSSDTGWTQKYSGAALDSSDGTARRARTGATVSVMSRSPSHANPSIAGSFYGARIYDVDNATVDVEVYADDAASATDNVTFTGTDGQTWTVNNVGSTLSLETDAEVWVPFTDGVSSTPAATVTGLVNGDETDFQVRGTNGAGTGAWSNVATATPTA